MLKSSNIEFVRNDDGIKGQIVGVSDGKTAGLVDYIWADKNLLIITHTEVEKAFEGKGIGKKIVLNAIEFAKSKGAKIGSHCSFATKVLNEE